MRSGWKSEREVFQLSSPPRVVSAIPLIIITAVNIIIFILVIISHFE